MTGKVLAADLGATNLRVALVSREGKILSILKARTPRAGGPNAVPDAIAELARRASATGTPDRIGVSTIGPLDLAEGVIVNTPNLPFKRIELRRRLEEKLGMEVYLVNDAAAGALGENVFGAGKGAKNIVYITFSTGLGGGVIVDGRLLVGRRGNAHEIGHLVVNYDDETRCGCGGIGHWEAYCSGHGLPKLAKLVAERTGATSETARLAKNGALAPEELFNAARSGDEFSLIVVEEFSRIAAAGIASVVSAYDPEVVVMGGPVYLYNRDLLDCRISRWLSEYSLGEPPPIRAAALGENSPLIGAAVAAMRRWRPL